MLAHYLCAYAGRTTPRSGHYTGLSQARSRKVGTVVEGAKRKCPSHVENSSPKRAEDSEFVRFVESHQDTYNIYIYIYIYYIPQVVALKAHLLQASRAVHRRPLSAAGAKSLSAWACRTDRLWYEPKSWRVTPTPNPEKVVIFVYAYCIPHLSLIYVLLVTCVGLH